MKRLPKYYNVKIVHAKAQDVIIDEVFSYFGVVYRVVDKHEDEVEKGRHAVVFEAMNLYSGEIKEIYCTPNHELPVHKYIARV